jgi:predicted RNA-binding protein with PIN domain
LNERWVDAFNVMHKIGRLKSLMEKDLEEAREEFLRMLAPKVFRSGERWTVVFDGLSLGREKAPGPIHVIFTSDADAWILSSLRRHANPKSVTVVSSDEKDIGPEARAMGARVESADTLVKRLGTSRGAADRHASEKPDRSTPEEIDFWLDQFGGGETGEPKGDI